MKSIFLASMLSVASAAAVVTSVAPVMAQSVQDLRSEVTVKLESKISRLESEIAALEVQLADPTLSPGQAGQIRGALNARKAELRSCQLQLARVGRLPYRALVALNGRLPDPVSPT